MARDVYDVTTYPARNDLVDVTSATERGRELEIEVAELLRAADFRVTPNAGTARPRQTDLFAEGDGIDLLIEVKNRKRRVDVSDVDALRSRLGRIPSNIVGVIFTTSGLTDGAIKAIESDRTREVLAIVKAEIEQLRSGRQNLRTLIDRKREELRAQGRAWFSSATHSQFVGVGLPSGSIEFRLGKTIAPFFESRSDFAGARYALHIPDSGCGISGGEGARLTLQLALNAVTDLRDIMGYLHEKFGLSTNGMFSIVSRCTGRQ